jgi:hypothetical protein
MEGILLELLDFLYDAADFLGPCEPIVNAVIDVLRAIITTLCP